MFERSSKLYLYRGKITVLHYLFRVEKRKNTCLGCQIPLLYLFRDVNFSPGNTCLGCFLWVHGRSWYLILSLEWHPRGAWHNHSSKIYQTLDGQDLFDQWTTLWMYRYKGVHSMINTCFLWTLIRDFVLLCNEKLNEHWTITRHNLGELHFKGISWVPLLTILDLPHFVGKSEK